MRTGQSETRAAEYLRDKYPRDTRLLWELDGPPDTEIATIQGWHVLGSDRLHTVVVWIYQNEDGFAVFVED